MRERSVFHCDKCGKCCENLQRSRLYDDLNDGTGSCVYFDKSTRLCSIYDHRPDKCNIAKFYKNVNKLMSWEEYLQLNYEACKRLKEA